MQLSAAESMSTLSREDNLAFSSEDSSSPDESGLELGLSLGGGAVRSRCARILTAKDFSSSSASAASSSSSSSLSRGSVTAGTKRSADSVAAGNGVSQVVGWPPLRACRMNSLINNAKSAASEVSESMDEESRCITKVIRKTEHGDEKKNVNSKVKGHRSSLFVKVNMDGIPIGRKVDLSAHNGYEALAHTLEDMFNEPTTLVKLRLSGKDGPSRLLDGSSENVLTYEDREGDWMLVGDVPWGMFLCSVKRLRIMRTSEANGLSPRLQERNGRQRCERN